MAKWINAALTIGIVAFWAWMTGALVQRQIELSNMDMYRRGVTTFFGNEIQRERWMGIYRGGRKIGYSGFIFQRDFADEKVQHHVSIEGKIVFDLFGLGRTIDFNGSIEADLQMVPERLSMKISHGQGSIVIEGTRRDNTLLLRANVLGRVIEHSLPLKEYFFSDGLMPSLPIAGFEAGQTFRVPIVNPLFQTTSMASIEVKERTTRFYNGLKADCFHLETQVDGITYQSWVTPDGETLQQDIPPPVDVILRREDRDSAKRGF